MLLAGKIHRLILVALITSLFYFVGPVKADTLGQNQVFNVNSKFDRQARSSLSATLRYASDHAYFYVEDAYWNGLSSTQQTTQKSRLEVLGREFDSNIYINEVNLWGSEPNPGVDNDPKITILFHGLSGNNGGYFDSTHGFPKINAEDSNQREMLFISADSLGNFDKKFIAHEFQHLISFNRKDLRLRVGEDIWLNELRSEYSVEALDYNDPFTGSSLDARLRYFLENPSDSLTEWPNTLYDYAAVTLFGQYLVEQYGAGILAETIGYNNNGVPSLNSYLVNSSRTERFKDIFLNWMAASYLNNSAADKRFGYSREGLTNFRITPQLRTSLFDTGNSRSAYITQIEAWQPVWYEFTLNNLVDASRSFAIELDGDTSQKFAAKYVSITKNGMISSGDIPFNKGKGAAYISPGNSEQIDRVILLMTNATKTEGFSSNETAHVLNVNIGFDDAEAMRARNYSGEILDGSLIRQAANNDLYVVEGSYRRYLSPEVIKLYGHLDPANAIIVDEETFFSYKTSNYVKYINNDKVYAVWPDNTKHWLNMTEEYFRSSGRDAGAIFVISDLELNFYKTGADVIR